MVEFKCFETDPTAPISDAANEVLLGIAKTGEPVHPWADLRHLLNAKILQVINEFDVEQAYDPTGCGALEERKADLTEAVMCFQNAPFTLQRLVEVLREPRRCHRNVNKLINGLEKLLSVCSTIPYAEPSGSSSVSIQQEDEVPERLEAGPAVDGTPTIAASTTAATE